MAEFSTFVRLVFMITLLVTVARFVALAAPYGRARCWVEVDFSDVGVKEKAPQVPGGVACGAGGSGLPMVR